MMPIACPDCGRINSDEAGRCDCGRRLCEPSTPGPPLARGPGLLCRGTLAFAALTGLLVVLVEGPDVFAAWNLTPVLLAVVGALVARESEGWVRDPLWAGAVGSLVAVGVVALAHLAWHFDWGRFQTGSSTSALVFLFLPFWAVLIGGLAAGLGVIAHLALRLLAARRY